MLKRKPAVKKKIKKSSLLRFLVCQEYVNLIVLEVETQREAIHYAKGKRCEQNIFKGSCQKRDTYAGMQMKNYRSLDLVIISWSGLNVN